MVDVEQTILDVCLQKFTKTKWQNPDFHIDNFDNIEIGIKVFPGPQNLLNLLTSRYFV